MPKRESHRHFVHPHLCILYRDTFLPQCNAPTNEIKKLIAIKKSLNIASENKLAIPAINREHFIINHCKYCVYIKIATKNSQYLKIH